MYACDSSVGQWRDLRGVRRNRQGTVWHGIRTRFVRSVAHHGILVAPILANFASFVLFQCRILFPVVPRMSSCVCLLMLSAFRGKNLCCYPVFFAAFRSYLSKKCKNTYISSQRERIRAKWRLIRYNTLRISDPYPMAMMRKTREDVYDGAEPVGLTAPEDLDESYQPPVRDAPISAAIDVRRDKFPYAIVWTPIPCITWLLPFVGHMVPHLPYRRCGFICDDAVFVGVVPQGIADSAGAIHDFAGPYYIGYDDMAFGRPTRYLILDPKKITAPSKGSPTQAWNAGVEHGNSVYVKRMHNLMYADSFHTYGNACIVVSMQFDVCWLACADFRH